MLISSFLKYENNRNNGSSDIFYFGEIGQNLVSDLDVLGGIIDFEDDLGVYDVKIR